MKLYKLLYEVFSRVEKDRNANILEGRKFVAMRDDSMKVDTESVL